MKILLPILALILILFMGLVLWHEATAGIPNKEHALVACKGATDTFYKRSSVILSTEAHLWKILDGLNVNTQGDANQMLDLLIILDELRASLAGLQVRQDMVCRGVLGDNWRDHMLQNRDTLRQWQRYTP